MYSLLLITENRNKDTNARKVDVGTKQRTYNGYDKSNGLSPTVNTDSVFLTGVIYDHERRAIEMLGTENDFLHAENDECVLILLHSKLA